MNGRWIAAAMLLAGCAPAANDEPDAGKGMRVYATNEISGDLTVIDPIARQVVARIPLGKRPRGITPSPDGKLIYVALSGSPIGGPGVDESALPPADKTADGIAVLDVASGKVLRVLRGISDPEQVAVSPDGERLYVASEDTGQMIVIDTDGGVRAKLAVGGEPEGVAVSPDGKLAYATSEEASTVAVVETAAPRVRANIKVGERPRNAVFAPAGDRAYVTGEFDDSVAAIDVAADRVAASTKIGGGENSRPMGIVVTPDGSTLYVTTGRGKQLVRLDARDLKITGRTQVGDRPWGVALSPDARYLFTANGPSNDVSMVDAKTMKVVARFPAGERPWGVTAVELR